jgi:hypothetical protein
VIDTTAFNTYQFLREDTIAEKVYIYTPGYPGGTDQLLYDFSLVPGDTLKSAYTGNGLYLILDTIFNILLNNGETRKEFYFGSYPYGIYYIEGIGGCMGLFQPIMPGIESYGGYFCVKENSVILLGDHCDYGYVGQNEMRNEMVSVYPNPANSLINVVVPLNDEGSDFKLLNLQGEQVFLHSLTSGSNTFSIAGIIPGVYLYQVRSDKVIHNGKLTIY